MKKEIFLQESVISLRYIPSEMTETYEKLYETVNDAFEREKLSRFFPLQGIHYNEFWQLPSVNPEDYMGNQDKNEAMEPAVRLMIIGRSVNGWTEFREETADIFSETAANEITGNGFCWLDDNGLATKTYERQSDKKICRYNINKSSFFRCVRKILENLKPVAAIDSRWFEHIVWDNLYTFAPLHSGNATGKLQNIQIEFSRKLLLQHIKYFAPTHMLFITDWDYWFERFSDDFPEVLRTDKSESDNVVGKGFFSNAKVAVTVRPDRTRPTRPNEEKFVSDVLEFFKSGENY